MDSGKKKHGLFHTWGKWKRISEDNLDAWVEVVVIQQKICKKCGYKKITKQHIYA